MTRREWTCPTCGATLAVVDADHMVRPLVNADDNHKRRTVTLYCPCGAIRTWPLHGCEGVRWRRTEDAA